MENSKGPEQRELSPSRLQPILAKHLNALGWTEEYFAQKIGNDLWARVKNHLLGKGGEREGMTRATANQIVWHLLEGYEAKEHPTGKNKSGRKKKVESEMGVARLPNILYEVLTACGYNPAKNRGDSFERISHTREIHVGWTPWEGNHEHIWHKASGVSAELVKRVACLMGVGVNYCKFPSEDAIAEALDRKTIDVGAPYPYKIHLNAKRTTLITVASILQATERHLQALQKQYQERMTQVIHEPMDEPLPLPPVMITQYEETDLVRSLDLSLDIIQRK